MEDQNVGAKLFTIKHKRSDCQHISVELDLESRTVLCSNCGRQIDAFDYLLIQATNEVTTLAMLANRREELRKLNKEVETLKRKKVIYGNGKSI